MRRSACVAVAIMVLIAVVDTRPAAPLRVCADPDNLPFTSRQSGGFEIDIARMLANDLSRPLEFTWWPQRRGFLRNTLLANACDVVPGYPSRADGVRTSRPYYRSTYVFLTRPDTPVASFDDPQLRTVRIAIPLVGDSDGNAPPAHALSRRGIMRNVRALPLSVSGGGTPPIVAAVAQHTVDVGIAWGPAVGFFAARASPAIELRPVAPASDGLIPEVYDISMAVRRDDEMLQRSIDRFIARRQSDIDIVLRRYHVPLLSVPVDPAARTAAPGAR
jgi:mxaJ protein